MHLVSGDRFGVLHKGEAWSDEARLTFQEPDLKQWADSAG